MALFDGFSGSFCHNIIDEVDFAGFLICGGMELEEGGDADGIMLGPEEGVHGLLSSVVPSGESNTIRIGVGEENDFVVLKGDELGDLEFAEASSSQPDILRIKLRKNNC